LDGVLLVLTEGIFWTLDQPRQYRINFFLSGKFTSLQSPLSWSLVASLQLLFFLGRIGRNLGHVVHHAEGTAAQAAEKSMRNKAMNERYRWGSITSSPIWDSSAKNHTTSGGFDDNPP
jgi:hypothetical protein